MVNQPSSVIAIEALERAVLITDLVESTALVDRLGDRRATELLNLEESAARDLARRYQGTEIDKSDGFLFLFEYAWQAVGFALEYHDLLAELSRSRDVVLQARIGIHVGEIYLHANSPEHVAVGAKPLEVTGIAKPVAARLMTASTGGQTLLTDAVRQRAEHACSQHLPPWWQVEWRSHGWFSLKGVLLPQEVIEVGRTGFLRGTAPLETDKVASVTRRTRRRFLSWAGLAAAAAVLPLGGWAWWRFWRPAFARSDRLLLADWQVSVADPALGAELPDVLRVAFRIALEQSRFAVVLSEQTVADALDRMRTPPASALDRKLAAEVAQREGAKLVLVPQAVAGDGQLRTLDSGKSAGSLRLVVDLVDPELDRVVSSVEVLATGGTQLITALDALALEVRRALGESWRESLRSTQPLAQVTSANLDALRAYTRAEIKLRERQPQEALRLFEQAGVLDPEFASAFARLGTVQLMLRAEPELAEANWQRAAQLSERLVRREYLNVQACVAWSSDPRQMRARWRALRDEYPQEAAAHNNVGIVEWLHFGDLMAAEAAFRRATRIAHPWGYRAWNNLGWVLLGLDRGDESLRAFETSLALVDDPLNFGQLRWYLAQGQIRPARRFLDRYPLAPQSAPSERADLLQAEILLASFERDYSRAIKLSGELVARALEWNFPDAERSGLRNLLCLQGMQADHSGQRQAWDGLRRAVLPQLAVSRGGGLQVPLFDAFWMALCAEKHRWPDAGELLGPLELHGRWREYPLLQAMQRLLRGWQALRRGDPSAALRFVAESRVHAPLYLALELEVEALLAQGEVPAARERATQAVQRLHLALSEGYHYFGTQLINLLVWQRMRGVLAG